MKNLEESSSNIEETKLCFIEDDKNFHGTWHSTTILFFAAKNLISVMMGAAWCESCLITCIYSRILCCSSWRKDVRIVGKGCVGTSHYCSSIEKYCSEKKKRQNLQDRLLNYLHSFYKLYSGILTHFILEERRCGMAEKGCVGTSHCCSSIDKYCSEKKKRQNLEDMLLNYIVFII